MVTAFDTSLCPPTGTISAECGGTTVLNLSGPIPAGLVASPPAMSISAGGSATFTIGTVSPPLSGQVTFIVAGCPPVSTCTFSVGSVVAGGSLSLNVTTTAHGIGLPAPSARRSPPSSRILVAVWEILLSLITLVVITIRKDRRHGQIGFASIVVLLAATVIFSDGCGITANNTPPAPAPGTSAGVYPMVVTATSIANVTATTTVSLTVN